MARFAAIDFETANHYRDSACALGLVLCDGGEIVARHHRLIRPPSQYFHFSYLHGITWDDVAEAPRFRSLWLSLRPLLEGVEFLAAHNAGFDRSVLRACCEAARLRPPPMPFVCTVGLARRQWDIRPTKLPDVCRRLRIGLKHHDAESDAEACARIVLTAEQEGWQP